MKDITYRTYFLTIVFIIWFVGGTVAASTIRTSNTGNIKTMYNPSASADFTDDPIYIDGNFSESAAEFGWEGSGTENDPYIISDLYIDASTSHGIHICNTDEYFVIEKVTIRGNIYYGFLLDNATHGLLSDNVIYENDIGIYFNKTSDNEIHNNEIHNNSIGIYLKNSNGTDINENIILNNTDHSIYEDNSTDNYFWNNYCEDSEYTAPHPFKITQHNTTAQRRDEITIIWTESQYRDTYMVYMDGSILEDDIDYEIYKFNAPAESGVHQIYVKATNDNGETVSENTVEFTVEEYTPGFFEAIFIVIQNSFMIILAMLSCGIVSYLDNRKKRKKEICDCKGKPDCVCDPDK